MSELLLAEEPVAAAAVNACYSIIGRNLKTMKVVPQLLFFSALVGCSSGKGALEKAAVALSENSDTTSTSVERRAEVDYPVPPPADYHVDLSLVSDQIDSCLLYTSPSPRDATLSRMPSSA